jgi:hypothetical protein
MLPRLERGHDGVTALGGVCARVPHRRRVAATDPAAGQAEPQMHPRCAQSKAVLAALRSARPDGPDQGKVGIGQDRLRCIAHAAEHRKADALMPLPCLRCVSPAR